MDKSQKIKVLFRHRSMEMGGVEKVLLSMLNNLDREKFELSVGINLYQGELRDALPKGVKVSFLAGGKEDFPKGSILNKIFLVARGVKLFLFRKLPIIPNKFILNNNADVEIATGYTMFEDVLNSSNKKSKKIGWFHSDITFSKLQPIVPKLLKEIEQFDYFIFGSQQAQDIFEQTYPNVKLPPNKVILNAIPIEEIREKSNKENIEREKLPTFVSIGRLHSRKGYHTLIDAHKKLLNLGFNHKIWVIGNGEEEENLRVKIKELHLEDTFLLLGAKMNPYPYVKTADYFIMPSESEGWPLIIAETLLLKKPIIATNVGGIPEMIKHKETGFLCEYGADDLCQAMLAFLQDKELVKQIEYNLQDIDNQFDNQAIFDTVEKIIINLANA
ncbi:glycosyltransferase [Riemerella anatipestifer]|uniref:glycosyltransferase n=1 Tax=Riemerella anatipestifer TaxID=34085 RepID=UPI00129E9056|nr:glycosyltransferase [Riemerella anatipestifer]MRM82834.1 glycosyltransferase [Riemerella anatipestifer]